MPSATSDRWRRTASRMPSWRPPDGPVHRAARRCRWRPFAGRSGLPRSCRSRPSSSSTTPPRSRPSWPSSKRHARTRRIRRSGDRAGRRRADRATDGAAQWPVTGTSSAAELGRAAMTTVEELTGYSPEAVTALEWDGELWQITVDVLELARIPNTTDVIGELRRPARRERRRCRLPPRAPLPPLPGRGQD